MTKPALFVRIAAGLTFVHAVLHTVRRSLWPSRAGSRHRCRAGDEDQPVSADGTHAELLGFLSRARAGVTIFLTAEAVLFWQLGSLAKTEARQLRPILATFFVAYGALAVNAHAYFFLGPVITEIFIATASGWRLLPPSFNQQIMLGRRSGLI